MGEPGECASVKSHGWNLAPILLLAHPPMKADSSSYLLGGGEEVRN